jgi:predicted dehydrogenase
MKIYRLAVVGPGLIGKRHIDLINSHLECELIGVVAPNHPENVEVANRWQVPLFCDLKSMFEVVRVDGVIIASPNNFHVQQALECIENSTPVLLEKPIADSYEDGLKLLQAANDKNAKLLIGHHRIHSPILSTAKKIIHDGVIGKIVGISGSALFYKPKDYFMEGPWRSLPGGGPILINLIHEIGNFREFCGEIKKVQAITSSHIRGSVVEDSAVVNFQFENGILGSFFLSDTACSGRSWEQTTQENKSFASYVDEDCYHITGTNGSLSIPSMRIKYHTQESPPSWLNLMSEKVVEFKPMDPLQEQLQHFIRVIKGIETPKVSAYDGLQNLLVVEAIYESAATGMTVTLEGKS